ncbi:hypothetical protein VTG60DRAFT_7187 [Thermothelomyces hinnuleus]
MDPDQGGHHGSSGRADDDARQQAPQVQGLDYAEMAEAEYGTALQHECSPPETLSSVVDKVEQVLHRECRLGHAALAETRGGGSADGALLVTATLESATGAAATAPAQLAVFPLRGKPFHGRLPLVLWRRRQHDDLLDRLDKLLDIFLNEVLGAGKGAIEKLGAGDVAQVADESRAQRVDELVDVSGLAGVGDKPQAFVDQPEVVVLARRVVAPQVKTEAEIEVLCRLGPLFVGRRGAEVMGVLL